MCDVFTISALRPQETDEITPVSAEHSKTRNADESNNAARYAIDRDSYTRSSTSDGADGERWLKVNLAKVNCIKKVIMYYGGDPDHTWTCTSSDCSTCQPNTNQNYCHKYTLKVSAEKTSSDGLPLLSDCRYGDTVKVEFIMTAPFSQVYELAIIGKSEETAGEIICNE